MRRAALLLHALFLLAACGSEETPAAETTSSASASSAVASSTVSSPTVSDPLASAAADDVDETAQLQEAAGGASWAGLITEALRTEPGRLEVTTSIVDPRGENGSPEALQAFEVCEGAVAYLQAQDAPATNVRVNEADGTAFVIYGAPAGDACTEY